MESDSEGGRTARSGGGELKFTVGLTRVTSITATLPSRPMVRRLETRCGFLPRLVRPDFDVWIPVASSLRKPLSVGVHRLNSKLIMSRYCLMFVSLSNVCLCFRQHCSVGNQLIAPRLVFVYDLANGRRAALN